MRMYGYTLSLSAAIFGLTTIFYPANAQTTDPEAFAKSVVDAARQSKMSRAPLDEGGVVWTGPESSPKPIEKASVAVMPCPLSLGVCQYLFESAKEAAEAIG